MLAFPCCCPFQDNINSTNVSEKQQRPTKTKMAALYSSPIHGKGVTHIFENEKSTDEKGKYAHQTEKQTKDCRGKQKQKLLEAKKVADFPLPTSWLIYLKGKEA